MKLQRFRQVGRTVFTLPICLRLPRDPGYPPSDEEVVNYFGPLSKSDDRTTTAHIAIVCFIAAAHTTMLNWLQEEQEKQEKSAPQLLSYWHQLMESPEKRDRREQFFKEVVQRAHSASHFSFFFRQVLIV